MDEGASLEERVAGIEGILSRISERFNHVEAELRNKVGAAPDPLSSAQGRALPDLP